MDWAGKQHPVEILAEWAAPAVFAGAVGWSAWTIGLAVSAVAAAALVGFGIGVAVIRTLGQARAAAAAAFEPAPFDVETADELLLDDPLVDTGELLLDDPLVEISEDARVVRLFARQDPTPGELVLRIEDFLGDGVRRVVPAPEPRAMPDASAALQVALANVRASLK